MPSVTALDRCFDSPKSITCVTEAALNGPFRLKSINDHCPYSTDLQSVGTSLYHAVLGLQITVTEAIGMHIVDLHSGRSIYESC